MDSSTKKERPARQRASKDVLLMELTRKGIHLLVVLVPAMAAYNRSLTIWILAVGIIAYAIFETLRRSGIAVPIVTRVTVMAMRERDRGKFVLGPITLGFGALLSLLAFPHPSSTIAILALGFGDGLSSLAGRLFGRVDLPLTRGKSLEGSLTCFAAVFVSALVVTGNPAGSAAIAVFAMAVEAIPAGDFDNIILPVAVGMAAELLF